MILGGGLTGLAAGWASGLAVYEARNVAGGICASYYVRSDGRPHTGGDAEAYRFEIGGGHWIWGADPLVSRLISSLTAVRTYERRAAVYFPNEGLLVPYPLQYHLRHTGPKVASQALEEMVGAAEAKRPVVTLADWLEGSFGPTLCDLFFHPFHELYTAGLWRTLAPPDAAKSPVSLSLAIRGALQEVAGTGYNATFLYPVEGLNTLAERMATRCRIHYGRRVVRVDLDHKIVCFSDGEAVPYSSLVSTLALNRMIEMCSLSIAGEADPFTSVLVVNIGARKGPRCPQEHWVYVPRSRAGFHRVGFYSNVDRDFLPASARESADLVSAYVEKAYTGGQKPADADIDQVCKAIVEELTDWGWIGETELVHSTWVDVAYTWARPGSLWSRNALAALAAQQIYQVGRYGRWVLELGAQGITGSLREGLVAGAAFGVGPGPRKGD